MSYSIALLQLMQIADSAVPIGATSHSFGLETLAAEGTLHVEQLAGYVSTFLYEAGTLEGAYCRAGFRLAALESDSEFETRWLEANDRLSALKPARETRTGSMTLGRRLLQLVGTLEPVPALARVIPLVRQRQSAAHLSIAFGLIAGALGLDEETTVVAFLHQMVTGIVSAGQRLLPLGQQQAAGLLWKVKADIVSAAERSRMADIDALACFCPLIDVAGMRHPGLSTRLFIS